MYIVFFVGNLLYKMCEDLVDLIMHALIWRCKAFDGLFFYFLKQATEVN